MPVWIYFYRVNTHKGKKKASAFLSLISPALYPGPRCLQWKGQGWQHLWGRPNDSAGELVANCHQPFLGRQRLIRTVVARTTDLADVLTLHLYRHSQKGAEMPFAWISFARPKVGRHHRILSSSSLILPQRPGPSQDHRAWGVSSRTKDQVCTRRGLSMCWSWEKLAQVGAELAASRQRVACTNISELQILDSILLTGAPDQNN